jgi:hypothetical protein
VGSRAAGGRGRRGGRLSDDDIDRRAAQLFDEGARKLAEAWDEEAGLVRYETAFGAYHDARGSLAYTGVLLLDGGEDDVARAERILQVVASMQERRPQDAHYGNFRWFYEDEVVTDLNAVEFVLDGLNHLVRAGFQKLSAASRDLVLDMIRLGLDEIDRLDVHASYTNIALSDVCNSVLGGEAIGDPAYVERGARRLDEWFAFTNRSGAPHEYNSPTYLAVDIGRMAALAEHTRDPRIALKARIAEEQLWLHVAAHYHPELAELAGPHSRSYRDGWTGAGGYLKLVVWKLLGDDALRRTTTYYPRGREEGHIGVAETTYHCPPYVLDWLRAKRYPFVTSEQADAAHRNDITTYVTDAYALGTAAASYGVGEPPEHWQQPNSMLLQFQRDGDPPYGVMYARYVINDKTPGATMHESMRDAEDFWDEGRFAGAQHRNRAIIAYGLLPRVRPTHSYKMTLRILGGASSQVWAGDRRIDQFPAAIEPGEPITVDVGDVYIAMIPLEPTNMGADAPIDLSVVGHELVLDVYNYRGPAKSFWEHRSQGGPFYKGNVRNAVVVEVDGRSEVESFDAFRATIASAVIVDSVDDDLAREIAYARDGETLSLRYSLRDMRVIERKHNGAVYTPPMGVAGALDGAGPQWVRSRDALIELGGAKLMAGRTPKSFFADDETQRYVFVNPSEELAPVWLETPSTFIECDEFGFGRIKIDDASSAVTVDAAGPIAAIRLRAAPNGRLIVNGEDVTDRLAGPDADGVRELPGAWS